MNQFKINYWTISEIFLTLIIGFITTLVVIKQLYEMNDIPFTGNISVIWFSVSFIIYGTETLVRYVIWKNSEALHKRVKGYSFWLVFAFSIILLFIPFFKGEIPY